MHLFSVLFVNKLVLSNSLSIFILFIYCVYIYVYSLCMGVCVNRRPVKHVNYPDILLLYILETGSLIKCGVS